MNKRVLALVFVLVIAGGFCVVGAQQKQAPVRSSAATEKHEVYPPFYTYTGKYYGFITSTSLLRRGNKVTPEEVRKSVAEGARYVFSPGRMELDPQEKAAPFAGQQVWLTGSITTQKYGTGPTSDETIHGYSAGDGTVASRWETLKIISITPTKRDDLYADFQREGNSASISVEEVHENYVKPTPTQ